MAAVYAVAQWIFFASSVIFAIFLNIIIVRHFSSRKSGQWNTSTMAVLLLSTALISTCLVPVDIYAASVVDNVHQHESKLLKTIKILYYVFYSISLCLLFVIIPFVYFWYEAYDPNKGKGKQFFDAFKFTIGFIILILIIIITGIFVKSGGQNNGDDKNFNDWVKFIFDSGNKGEGVLLFCIFCLTLLGLLAWVTYTAFGIAALPILMIKGKKSIEEENDEYKREIQIRREQKQSLLSDSEDIQTVRLINRARSLEKQAKGCIAKCRPFWRPISIFLGVLFSIFSITLVVSMFLGVLDKTLNNYCGAKCGFFLKRAKLFNPFDRFLIVLKKAYPLDFFFIGFTILYFFFATLKGISRMGIRILCLLLYKFQKQATEPQGLILGAVILKLCSLAINVQLLTLAPQYAYWGGKRYFNVTDNSTYDCSIEYVNVTNGCTMTQLGVIVSKMQLRGPFFGIAFYGFMWLFILVWLISIVVAICLKRQSNIAELSDDDFEDEEYIRESGRLIL